MNRKKKVIFCWSGGKDSALALYHVLKSNEYDVIALLTTVNQTYKRISMHGVREELLEQQASSIGIPLIKMYLSEGSNLEYEREMEKLLLRYKTQGVEAVVFGDIFLEDLRVYREHNLSKVGLKALFPLWKRDTKELIEEFFRLNFKTVVCCVNDAFLDNNSVGVELDRAFKNTLPENVDVCGENGEFHTFCYEGPLFKKRIDFLIGEKVYKPIETKIEGSLTKGFWYCDLLPAN